MLAKSTTLALLAVQALSSLASPLADPFTVQDSDSDFHTLASGSTCIDAESAIPPDNAPEVCLDDGLFVGYRKAQSPEIDYYLGIPFAIPPTDDRRLRPPQPTRPYMGTHFAQAFGKSCPQQAVTFPDGLNPRLVKDVAAIVDPLYHGITESDEDCLTLNVVRPSNARPDSELPVLVWIHGGGFETGGSSPYDGAAVVSRSLDLKQPVIFVSMNYRLSAFGFLPGKEVKNAEVGNLGLQDQRLALKWIRTYIKEFGGDPTKVTIWGESAGAISVFLHMSTNNGNQEGLFRGAVMQSGGPYPLGDIEHGQEYYDHMVKETGCSNQSNTLECLRGVSYTTFKEAMDKSPHFFSYQGPVLAWMPRVDGVFLTEPAQDSVIRGHVSNVPVITGNCEDEGTLFGIPTLNISTTADVKDYVKSIMLPRAGDKEIDDLLVHYPDDLTAGCPFDTGTRNALGPQFKRVAALLGDFIFHGPRRIFLKYRAKEQNSWGFVFKRFKDTPFLGSAHVADLVNSFGPGGELKDYIIRFTNKLDPNGREGLGIEWPKWDPAKPRALVLTDEIRSPLVIEDDNYRSRALDYFENLTIRYPI